MIENGDIHFYSKCMGFVSLFREVNCVSKVCYNHFFVVQLGTYIFIVSL